MTAFLVIPSGKARICSMDKALSSQTIVGVELIADVLVAIVKLLTAFFTGVASMGAEGAHSVVDVGSGGMMLYGYHRSERGPDRRHPLGHGRELYFWSFVVALLFSRSTRGFNLRRPAANARPTFAHPSRSIWFWRRKRFSREPRGCSHCERSVQPKATFLTGRR
jgi:hypothetical protein